MLKTLLTLAVASAISLGPSTAQSVPEYYAPVNPVFPGFGRDNSHVAPPTFVHEPMAYGLFVSAFLQDGMLGDARRAADWLVKNRDINRDGVPGWGLPYPWDAFSDDSINPAHMVYGITTAVAAQGLLDLYEETAEAGYLSTAVAALEAYAEELEKGSLHYSVAPTDTTPVHNVTAMLMGQYQRAADLADRPDFARLADKAYSYILSKALSDENGIWWNYSTAADAKPNDLIHAAYIVRGLIDYGAPANVVTDALHGLHRFIRNGSVYELVYRDDLLARSWGIGAALNVACELGDASLVSALKQALPLYLKDGAYLLRPNEGAFAPRLQAHIAWGLSRCP